MLVVPIEKDVILTKDKQLLKVIEYTNYKDGGPAVYCRTKTDKTPILIYFFDIAEINGVKVEFNRSSKIFNAMGKLTRSQHLPQPDDDIAIINRKKTEDRPERRIHVEVDSLKLKGRNIRSGQGMLVKDTDGANHRLRHIVGITRAIGSSSFNRDEFVRLYQHYMGG